VNNRKATGTMTCGFCSTGNHAKCPVVIRNGSAAANPLHFCPCAECSDKKNHHFCIECKNAFEADVDPDSWSCIDQGACQARIKARVDADPVIQNIRDIKERVKMTEKTEKAEKATKAPKEGVCIVTGKKTSGGKFAPGMDARYVSLKVAAVVAKDTTKAEVLKEMKGHGLSDALVAKFEKNLGIAQDKAAKAKQAEAAKAAEKKSEGKAAAKA
jgi:hypothetical protein